MASLEPLLREMTALVHQWEHRQDEMARDLGISRASGRVLRAAATSPESVARLARRLGLTRQSVQRLADRLVDSGLARYESNPHHRRSPLLVLTEEGVGVWKALERGLREWEPALAEDFEEEEIETALQVLRGLRQGFPE